MPTRFHYWLVAYDEDGKKYIIYGGTQEEESRRKGIEMLSGVDFELRRLPTRNLREASSLLKRGRLERKLKSIGNRGEQRYRLSDRYKRSRLRSSTAPRRGGVE